MNFGEKIRTLREGKNLTVEELATRINDSIENLNKYENNELEPTLDKKLSLSIELGVSLSELSYSIEQKYVQNNITKNNEEQEELNIDEVEEVIETPFATSSITYNEQVFDQVFKGSYTRSFVQSAIFIFGYILCGIFTITSQVTIFSYLCFGIALISLIKLITSYTRYKASKKSWLQEYSHTTREYQYYQEYIKVISGLDESKIIEYQAFVRVIEHKNYMVALYLEEVPTFLVIDTSSLVDDQLIKVRTAFKQACPNYIDMNIAKENKTHNPKLKKLNIVLWCFAILALFSVTIVSTIIRLFTKDTTLFINILTYILAMILPIVSLILGIVSKKKYDYPSSKNTIIGIIMTAGCLLFMLVTIVQAPLYTKYNNDNLVSYIEETSQTQMPTDYSTIYYNSDTNTESKNNLSYTTAVYQVWTFAKTSEIEELETSIQNSLLWQKNNNELNNRYGFSVSDTAKSLLKSMGYEVPEQADYILLINLTNGKCNDLVDSTGEKYVSLMYFEEDNYMIAVEFSCNK